jgi:hypothetical protein
MPLLVRLMLIVVVGLVGVLAACAVGSALVEWVLAHRGLLA